MAEAFINAVQSAGEGNSPKAPLCTPSHDKSSSSGGKKKSSTRSTKKSSTKTKVSEDCLELSTTAGTSSFSLEDSLRTEIDSVKTSVTSIASKMEQFLPLLQKLVTTDTNDIVTVGGQNVSRDSATLGGQSSQDDRDVATSGGQNYHNRSRASHDNEVDCDDAVSIAPGRGERRSLDNDLSHYNSDNDSDSIGSSVSRQNRNSSRFHRYSWVDEGSDNVNVDNQEKSSANKTKSVLGNIFGEDAKTKPEKSECGICLDQSQIDILNQNWHCDNPVLLSTYKEEYRSSFPVSSNSSEFLDLPKLDDVVSSLLTKHHGPKASKIKGNKLFSQPHKTYENYAFKGQSSARMGLVITAYMQQALGTLMEKLNESEPNVDLVIQMVKDIFAMSVKTMDQIGRAGAFHHLIRRKAAMVDTGLDTISDLTDKVLSMKLSSEGVLGKNFEETLQKRSETNKQIKDLLPEYHHKPTNSSTGTKRKFSGVSNSNQEASNSKIPRNDNARNFKIPKLDKSNESRGSFSGSNFKKNYDNKKDFGKKGSFRNNRAK